MTLAEQLKKEGEKIGEKRGEKVGEKRGVMIGEKKGVLSVALNLLRIGVDVKLVTDSTGLSHEEIRELKLRHGLA